MNEPPMRVTLVHGGIAIYLLSSGAAISIMSGGSDYTTNGLGNWFVLPMLIVREPLFVFWATKITEGNREEQRQKILQVELEEARKRREEMKSKRQQPDDQDDQISLGEDEIKIIVEDEEDQIEQLNAPNLLKRSNKILPASQRIVAWTARTKSLG